MCKDEGLQKPRVFLKVENVIGMTFFLFFISLNFIEKLIELPWENGTFVISHLVRISGLKTEVIITGYKKFYKIDS